MAQKEKMMLTNDHFAAMYQLMQRHGDHDNADKVLDLFEKYTTNQYNICFAGHFSAGKSSIINYVLGKDVLPKSPIPTSANIVKITSGEGNAKVFFKEESPVQYNEPYDIDMIKDYCMDKDTIKQIEISTAEDILPENCALLDTPGIDAADDADRLMTESAIHLIDVLFYVMDYNHVQSEVNLYFLQEMKKQGIPIYIIINQVDKHNEEELPFISYDEKVKQTFDQWGIFPENIFYSSVTKPEVSYNQLPQIKQTLFDMMEHHPEENHLQMRKALYAVVESHKKFVAEQLLGEEEEQTNPDLQTEEQEKMMGLENRLIEIAERPKMVHKEFSEEVQITLKNAYIMPAKLRDMAKDFLESQQKDFKIGIFQSKKKTDEAKEDRLTTFLTALKESMETNIQWKLREKTLELLQKFDVSTDELMKQTQQLSISFHQDDLNTFMKAGAKVNGNYILNYTNDLSSSIKNKYRQEANALWENIKKYSTAKWQLEQDAIEKELKPYTEQKLLLHKQEEIKKETEQKQAFIDQQLESPTADLTDITPLQVALQIQNQIKIEESPENIILNSARQENIAEEIPQDKAVYVNDTDTIIQSIDHVINELTHMDGFTSILNDLAAKKARLTNRALTIALFGTFSAGKSSFSNALFGERILPVSPNPTTAVISRISPVTKEYIHGTVLIKLKDEDELVDDLSSMTKHLEHGDMVLEKWIGWIKKNRVFADDSLSKTYQAYLEALLVGYEEQKERLGKTVEITLDDFAAFVTDETKACYIKTVDLYYDCALTRKGITLVDTPGADSVNARHTNVAFDYIKEADAILYVTYYNHAITSGDRDFLMQLGRVKESFEMDKMFFIVNASDLAESEADLQLVVKYVSEQLLQFGIRHPKIFPVSSKFSLEEKEQLLTLNKEMTRFEDAFYSFIEKDLIALTVESSLWDMNRAKLTLGEFIASLELSKADRIEKAKKLTEQKLLGEKTIDETMTTVFVDRLLDRIDRQLHFVLERLYIRFHEMFSEHFNSSTINASGKKALKQLEWSRNQFIDYTGYELLQEVRAVSLRIEAYMKELMKDSYDLMQKDTQAINDVFVLPSLETQHLDTPDYTQAFVTLDVAIFNKALKLFKNTKSFFEDNERQKMEEQFYSILQPFADDYLGEAKALMEKTYEDQWHTQLQEMKERAKTEIISIADEHVNMLSKSVDIGELQHKYHVLQQIISTHEEG